VVWLDGVRLGERKRIAATADWQEHAIELPETHPAMRIEARPAEWERFASFHYWLYARRRGREPRGATRSAPVAHECLSFAPPAYDFVRGQFSMRLRTLASGLRPENPASSSW